MSSDSEKPGFFGRLFGGKEKSQETPVEEIQEALETTQEGDDVPAPDDKEIVSEDSALATAEINQEEVEEKPIKKSWFARLKEGLGRSSTALTQNLTAIVTKRKLDADALQDIEDILIQADFGVETAMTVTDALSAERYNKDISEEEIRAILGAEVEKILTPVAKPLRIDPSKTPHVILVAGVNGTGKTTTIGKLAQKFRDDGHSVMLAAGDTFRAAAIEQLKIWADRTGSTIVARDTGSDAASLVFEAMDEAVAQNCDVLLIDTAGRLQNKTELMAELEKVVRIIKRKDETAPHTALLVLDATTGQNALNQVEVFKSTVGINGLVMTKLDGTARGGILVAVSKKYQLPIHFIGVGEGVEDLESFNAKDFAGAITGITNQDQSDD